jgi:mutator protein MutT
MEPLEIVLGIVVVKDRVLVRRRRHDPGLAEVWEFPGGKVEPGECHPAALAREIEEETGFRVRVAGLLTALCHEYPDRRVSLYVYRCALAGKTARIGWAGADRWVTPAECRRLPMPAANAHILISP